MNGHANNGSDWNAVSEHLDKALNDLPDDLRAAVVAYYLGKKTQEEIAAEEGVSAMTVSRRLKAGLEELRKDLAKAGVAMTAAVLATLLTERSVQAAPAALVAALDKMSLMAAATSAPTAASAAGAAGWKGVGTVAAGAGKGKLIACIIAAVVVVAAGAVTVAVRNAADPQPPAAPVEQGEPAGQTAERPAEYPAAASVEQGQPAARQVPAQARWSVARNDKMRLLHICVTFDKADGLYAIREHMGGGSSHSPLSEPLELMLETEMKDGLLHLHMIRQWRDRKSDIKMTPMLPEGATMHLVNLPPFAGLTTEYQVLWRADFVKAGGALRSVAYVARLMPIEEEYDGFGQEMQKVVEALRKSEEAPAEPPAGNTVTYELTYAIDGPQPDESAPAVADIITRRLVLAYGVMPQVEYAPDPPLGKRLRVTVAVSERVPLQDVRELIGMTGTLEFRLVCDDDALIAKAREGDVPAGYRWYTLRGRNGEQRVLVSDHAEMTGDYIKHASVERTTQTRQTEVLVAFNAAGQEVFGRITGDNVGRQLAIIANCIRDAGGGIVSEGRLCSAPSIRQRILGNASISGAFTRAEAERMAAALNSKPLPAPVRLQQQKVNGH